MSEAQGAKAPPRPKESARREAAGQAARKAERQRLARYFFFGAFLLLLYQSGRMLFAFYLPILAAILLVMLVYPVHARLLAAWPGRPSAAAAVTASLTLLLIVVPLCGIGWVFFNEAVRLAPVTRAWVDGLGDWQTRFAPASAAIETVRAWLAAWHIDPRAILLENLEEAGGHVASLAAALLTNAIVFAIDLAALVGLVFVLLRDGPSLLRKLSELVPMPHEHKELVLARVAETTLAVVHGALGVCAIQGALAGIGLAFFRVPFPVVLGFLTAILSGIPFLGIGTVMIPVVVALYMSGHADQALKVAVWAICVVGTADNLLRPLLIGAQVRLPLWLLFFGVLGGLKLYGFAGLLVGPVIVTVALAFASIYRKEYAAFLEAGFKQP